MPYISKWIDPDVALEHKGVKVYHIYDYSDYEEGPMDDWFTMDKKSGGIDDDSFDARELPVDQSGSSKDVLSRAIEAGILTANLPSEEIDNKIRSNDEQGI